MNQMGTQKRFGAGALLALVVQFGAVAPLVRAQQPAGSSGVAGATEAAVASTRSTYRIGPGDVVELRVLGEEQLSSTAIRVSGDGYIQVPFVDEDLRAQCLTERELGDLVATKLKKYLKYPEVHVAVKEFNSIPAAIIGAVNTPGRFQLQRRVSLIELLTFAGGVKTDTAGKTLHLIHTAPAVSCDAGFERRRRRRCGRRARNAESEEVARG